MNDRPELDTIFWIQALTAGRVEAVHPVGQGASRTAWFVTVRHDDGTTSELLLRHESGRGPTAGTELTLAREASVYRALDGRDVAVAPFIGLSGDGQDLLLGRMPGTGEWHAIPAAEGPGLMTSYVDELARVHRIDPDSLPRTELIRPATPADCAAEEVALWRRVLVGRVASPPPLLVAALEWFDQHAPRQVERIVLCHGDVGPGNFLFLDGRVTALVDWEFAHLGDPMDDLAWLAFRGHHMAPNCGDLSENLRRWSAATGQPLDAARIAYYRALVVARWLISCLSALAHDPDSPDHFIHRMLVPLTSYQLASLLEDLAVDRDERSAFGAFRRDSLPAVEANPAVAAVALQHFEPIRVGR